MEQRLASKEVQLEPASQERSSGVHAEAGKLETLAKTRELSFWGFCKGSQPQEGEAAHKRRRTSEVGVRPPKETLGRDACRKLLCSVGHRPLGYTHAAAGAWPAEAGPGKEG